jgi:endonuclease III
VQNASATAFTHAVDALATDASPVLFPNDPFRLILYENAGALVDDARRMALFERIIEIGPTPAALLGADRKALMAVALDGGMRPENRVARWYEIARITLDEAAGNLRARLAELDLKKQRALLKKYPVIGDPAADKILLFCDLAPQPSADSNVLRACERLRFIPPGDYTRQYRTACALQREAYGEDAAALKRCYHILREHAKTVCRRSGPDHAHCPIARLCTGTASH